MIARFANALGVLSFEFLKCHTHSATNISVQILCTYKYVRTKPSGIIRSSYRNSGN